MSIHCYACQGRHATAAAVRECASGGAPGLVQPKNRKFVDFSTPELATAAQRSYLTDLIRTKVAPENFDTVSVLASLEDNRLTKEEAKTFIPLLVAAPRKPKSTSERAEGVTKDGIYRDPKTGDIFKVQWNRGSGDGRALYAKRMSLSIFDGEGYVNTFVIPLEGQREMFEGAEISWNYIPGLLRKIRPEWRMSFEDAIQFGALYGQCLRCGRTLTAEVSIAKAIGPVCAGRENWG